LYTYQKLSALRTPQPVLIWGEYQDLRPDSPSVWCYRRQGQGQTLLVVATLSDQCQEWHPPHIKGQWQALLHNYGEVASQ
ncbi:alpha-glucosidase C-terminal domain-containing protein, partial [Salmonella enterica subsp. enterica serovar Infantis]